MNESDDEVEYEAESFDIGKFKFSLTTVSRLPIHILMSNQIKGIEISGQKLWCGSVSVAQYLLDNPNIVKNRFVIELGAGTGLLGMLCSKLDCCKVAVTDNDIRSINHMTHDCNTNRIQNISVHHLDWTNPNIDDIVNNFKSAQSNDVIVIAGDVLYKYSLIRPFFETVLEIFGKFRLLQYKVSMLLCHVPRAGVNHDAVANAIVSSNLRFDVIDPSKWRKGCCIELSPSEDYERAKIYSITL